MAEAPGSTLSRRNLPRSSHACQRCRLKKSKCDQQQPCSNCVKYAHECTYGLRRRTTREGKNHNSPRMAQAGDSPALPSPWSGHNEPNQRVGLEKTPPSEPSCDVNQHTHGTEFYGSSSNFVLLNQFFMYARRHQPPSQLDPVNQSRSSHQSPASSNAAAAAAASAPDMVTRPVLSIVNLLADEEGFDPPSRPKTPQQVTADIPQPLRDASLGANRPSSHRHDHNHVEAASRNEHISSSSNTMRNSSSRNQASHQDTVSVETSFQAVQQRLEREYIREYMYNLHTLHPMLDPTTFTTRCEQQIWNAKVPPERNKSQRHFLALYNIVVAVGSLVSGSTVAQSFEQDLRLCVKQAFLGQNITVTPSSQELSKIYFRKSRALLGNVFEVCSLESAQALLLMSLYCQNSLKPHACYMYCGHAVRTALAIGIERESQISSICDRKAARRTWWCIYSHEIDMSCSAGRRDSLGKPHNYRIDLPHIQGQASAEVNRDHLESRSVAMINEMVHFAAILRRISKQLYHDTKDLTLSQKSTVATKLDALLDEWKDRLPDYLNFDHTSFRDEEWASKQKLVLKLRYLNAKIVLYRPFLETNVRNPEAQVSAHVERLLQAARDTIHVMYAAYSSCHYFRTWWYNSTYTLYAGMIVLYIVMLDMTAIPLQDLLNDVTKAQDILQSMAELAVARRSANLIKEGLEVARAYVQGRLDRSLHTQTGDMSFNPFDINDITGQMSHAGIGQDPALFAMIVDPNLLQDFTAADTDMMGLDFSMATFDGLDGDEMHTNLGPSFLVTP